MTIRRLTKKGIELLKKLDCDMNCIIEIAKNKRKEKYVTPEDIAEALKLYKGQQVKDDILEIIGKQTEYGCEDISLCAFVAWKGKANIR